MNMYISSISIQCNNGSVLFPFSNHISFFYGNTGVGKTTLLSLINYALGQDLVHTNAVDSAVKSVSLDMYIFDKRLVIERHIHSNTISVIDGNRTLFFVAKNNGSNSKKDFSDYLYELAGIDPISMVQGKGSKAIRISFANYMWFSYLRQDELDNTFFYLDEKSSNFKHYASSFVLRSLLDESTIMQVNTKQEINTLRSKEEELHNKLSVYKEIASKSKLLSMNLGLEIAKKKQMLGKNNQIISQMLIDDNNASMDYLDLPELIELARNTGIYEAEIGYLQEFDKLISVRKNYDLLLQDCANARISYEKELQLMSTQSFSSILHEFSDIFKTILLQVEFPGFSSEDYIDINQTTLMPTVYSYNDKFKFDYRTLSSSGIRTIYKICFSLALHYYVTKKKNKTLLPTLLIIDTPMKNISERVDKRIYNNLYECIYSLFSNEGVLQDTQLIMIDKENSQYFEDKGVSCRMFTKDHPLIPHYIF